MSGPSVASLRILIVCSSNDFCSPLAEHLMRRECRGLDVRSAGVDANDGERAHEAARLMAVGHGLAELDGHRTRRLTTQGAIASDLILTMDERQRTHLVRSTPSRAGRVLLLGCWRGFEIGEPVVTSRSSREWTFALLQECVADWQRRLVSIGRSFAAAKAGGGVVHSRAVPSGPSHL